MDGYAHVYYLSGEKIAPGLIHGGPTSQYTGHKGSAGKVLVPN